LGNKRLERRPKKMNGREDLKGEGLLEKLRMMRPKEKKFFSV